MAVDTKGSIGLLDMRQPLVQVSLGLSSNRCFDRGSIEVAAVRSLPEGWNRTPWHEGGGEICQRQIPQPKHVLVAPSFEVR
jgi:hypothetical protein